MGVRSEPPRLGSGSPWFTELLLTLLHKVFCGPSQRGSTGWASFHKLRGQGFDSQSGLRAGLQVPPLSGPIPKAVYQCFCLASIFLSLSLSLPLLLLSKIKKKKSTLCPWAREMPHA